MTSAPSSASRTACARPCPRAAHVTKATRPCRPPPPAIATIPFIRRSVMGTCSAPETITAPKRGSVIYRTRRKFWPPTAFVRSLALRPAQLPQRDAVIPDLGHVADLVVTEVHHVDVVGLGAVAGRRYRSTLACVCPAEDAERCHVVARLVDGERPHLGGAVG